MFASLFILNRSDRINGSCIVVCGKVNVSCSMYYCAKELTSLKVIKNPQIWSGSFEICLRLGASGKDESI